MKHYLTKQNRKSTDIVILEVDDNLVRKSLGKVGKSGSAESTINAGSFEKAIEEINRQVQQFIDQGYSIALLPAKDELENIVFDKAKWHVNDDFPQELDQNQSYIHTGLYLCWLIENKLFNENFKTENLKGINLIFSRQVTPSQFYIDYLDGVFTSEGLTIEATKFTSVYFDFENGNYLKDYMETLDPQYNLPTIFHVLDTWENYDKLKPTIRQRYEAWRQSNKKKSVDLKG